MLKKLRNPLGFLVKPVDEKTHRLINDINQDQQMFARALFLAEVHGRMPLGIGLKGGSHFHPQRRRLVRQHQPGAQLPQFLHDLS